MRGHLAHDPGGPLIGDLGLHYRPGLPGQDLTLSVSGLMEDHRGPLDLQRYGVRAALRAPGFEATGTLYDEITPPAPGMSRK